ncbi:MAG: nuclear transport factor 2 family protein [Burkholderiaceae bacterium]
MIEDQHACVEVVYRFYRYLDQREYGQLDSLMTRDGIYVRPSGAHVPAGPSLIADLGKGSPTAAYAHLLTNVYAVVAGDGARVHGYMTVFQHDAGTAASAPRPLTQPTSIRDLVIHLRKEEGSWKVQRVDNQLLFRKQG